MELQSDQISCIENSQKSMRFAAFLKSLSVAVETQSEDEEILLGHASKLLEALVKHDDWLDDEFAKPGPEHGLTYLLYCDPQKRFSVVSVVWGPGHDTPVHDHTVWGAVGQLRGAEIEQTYLANNGSFELLSERRIESGEVVSFSPATGDVHRVRNAFDDRSSISIHVYGADIGSIDRQMFQMRDGSSKAFRTGYSNRFLPNVWVDTS